MKVSMSAAFRGVFSAPRMWVVLLSLTAIFFVAGALPRSASYLTLAITALVSGYEITVARYVFSGTPLWPPLFREGANVVRRTIAIFILVSLPVWLTAALFSVMALVPWEPLSTVAGSLAVALLLGGGLVLVPAGTVAFGSRYVCFDRLSESFRYYEGLVRLRRHWREGLLAMSFWPVWGYAALLLRFRIGQTLGVTNLHTKEGGILSLVVGGDLSSGAWIVLGLLAVSVFSAVGVLVWAHLLGQYSRLAHDTSGEPESVEQAHRAGAQ